MKLNEKSIKNESNINNKIDFSKNYTNINHNNNQNTDVKLVNDFNEDNNSKINIDPRLELTLKYLDIMHTLHIFVNNYISFNDLLLLSKNDLIELGFSLVERNRIFTFSQEYKNFGVKFNISEINDFFNKYENLNIRLVTNNNCNRYNNRTKENINENINYNFNNNNNNNKILYNNHNELLLEKDYINKSSEKKKSQTKKIIQKQNNISSNNNANDKYISKKNQTSKNNKPKDLNNIFPSQDSNYQDTINTNQNNLINNNNIQNSSNLIRQNSKVSKNSSYSKSSKSRLVTVSKIFGGNNGSIIQNYQNISEEIDNYFRKYNDYREQKKNRMKVYEILGTSNKRKNTKNIYKNKMKENKIDEKEINENVNKNREDEIKRRLLELQQRKKMLQERLNDICENDNKRLIMIKYLEEKEKLNCFYLLNLIIKYNIYLIYIN